MAACTAICRSAAYQNAHERFLILESEMDPIIIIVGIVCLAAGVAVALAVSRRSDSARVQAANEEIEKAKRTAEQVSKDAERAAESAKKEAILEAKEEILQLKQASEAEEKQRKTELRNLENRVMQREESLDRRSESLDKRDHQLSSLQGQLDRRANDLDALYDKQTSELERISALTSEDARQELIGKIRQQSVREEAQILRESEQRVRAKADKTAREIVSTAIQRCAADQAGEITVTSVHIPSDDLKGRIIGREGRNIRTFEQVTGVSLVIDDTPETVVLSSFDPVRRETARVTLENLIADGRIHPARIEDMYKKAETLVNERVREAGEQAAFDMGIHDLHPELIKTLGALRYRTSYGQNVLSHSVQVATLCGIMASELGMDEAPAKRAGLLHDIGKAIDHEVEGPHAVIGADLARRYGEKPEIVHAIEAHHADVEPDTVLDVLVQAADAISAARPGARRESAENYIKRLEKLEEIANAHEGVERTYAMQAGRELHVMVEPEKISDAQATVLAHDIAKQIEDEMEYPGQVRVVVIRESRAVDTAK
jgi:ribonuclease Y